MKRIITFLILFCFFLGLLSYKPENKYLLTEGQAIILVNTLQEVKENLHTSEMPINKAVKVLQAADSIQRVIGAQYAALNDTTRAKK